jgi:hypothetical protein
MVSGRVRRHTPLTPHSFRHGLGGEWACPDRRSRGRDRRLPGFVLSSASKRGKSLHLRLPSLLSEPRRYTRHSHADGRCTEKSAHIAERALLFGMGGDKWKVFSASTYSHPARVSYARAGRSLCGGRLALQQCANITDPTADAAC